MAIDPQSLGYRPCVGLMILNAHGAVWIGRRAGAERLTSAAYGGDQRDEQPEVPPSWWQMPQGGIDDGEMPEKAAMRELFEETGIREEHVEIIGESSDWHTYDLPAELIGKVWKGRFRGQKQKWFALRFAGSDSDVNITPDDPDMIEFDKWRWAHIDELMDLIIPFKRDVYRAVLDEFGPLACPAD